MQQIAVLGASFNPPTVGHWDVVEQALPHFDRILLVPSLAHAFAKSSIPIEYRLNMLKLFLHFWPGSNQILIENIEQQIQVQLPQAHPIYTFDVLMALQVKYPQDKISFILGPDLAKEEVWQKFYRYKDIEKNWALFQVEERIGIHSTQVRDLIANAESLDELKTSLPPLVGAAIADYIIQQRLYFREPS